MSSSKTTPLHLPVLILLVVLLLSTMSDAQSPSDDGDALVDNNPNVSPSMAIVVIVLVLGFFITGCIFIYIHQCTDTTSSSTVTPTTALMRNINASPGLPQTIIETFPIFPFSDVKHHKIGKGALECAVCLSDFLEDDETLRLLPKCNHVFHSECIDTWLVAHTTCPVCRDNLLAEVVPDSDDKLTNSNSTHLSTDDVRVTIPGRLPRSHSTGHSLNQLGEDHERFTLRIPAEVRRHIIDRTMMKRATSMVALPRQSSSRRGYRGGGGEGSGSSRYGRLFGRSFIMRVASLRSTAAAKVVAEGGPTTEFKVGSTQLPV